MLHVEVRGVGALRFDDGAPVRAASAVAPLGDGWLVAQDEATHAAWCRAASVTRLRVLPPVEGLDLFSEAEGTKHLKPDFEAACQVTVEGTPGVLLLGSGSSPARMRGALVRLADRRPRVVVADLSPLYALVAASLGLEAEGVNLEGACLLRGRLRWFNRGNLRAGIPSASVEVDLAALLGAVTGAHGAEAVQVDGMRPYDLGAVDGVGLAVTDAVALPGGRVLASAAAEDTPNAVDDGEVVGAALVLLEGHDVVAAAALPSGEDGTPWKVEGLGVRAATAGGVDLLAVVDADDPEAASSELTLHARWR